MNVSCRVSTALAVLTRTDNDNRDPLGPRRELLIINARFSMSPGIVSAVKVSVMAELILTMLYLLCLGVVVRVAAQAPVVEPPEDNPTRRLLSRWE